MGYQGLVGTDIGPIRPIDKVFGGQGRNRTADAGLFRAALYRLSYLAKLVGKSA